MLPWDQPQFYDVAFNHVVPKAGDRHVVVDGVVSLDNCVPPYLSDQLPTELYGILDPLQYMEFADDINSCLLREFYLRRADNGQQSG